jgi:hypothetical protein
LLYLSRIQRNRDDDVWMLSVDDYIVPKRFADCDPQSAGGDLRGYLDAHHSDWARPIS